MIKLSYLLILSFLISCSVKQKNEKARGGEDKRSHIKAYFDKQNWSYPFHIIPSPVRISSGLKLKAGNTDTSALKKNSEQLIQQSMPFFQSVLKVDTLTGYTFKGIGIKKEGNQIYYEVGVYKYLFNYRHQLIPCDGCESISNNEMWRSGNRALFYLKADYTLHFAHWED